MEHKGGWGVIATRAFAKGEFVCEYSGDLISITEARQREKQYTLVRMVCLTNVAGACEKAFFGKYFKPGLDFYFYLFFGARRRIRCGATQNPCATCTFCVTKKRRFAWTQRTAGALAGSSTTAAVAQIL